MKNALLLAVFAALLAAALAFSVFAFRADETVRFGLAAGPQSWWACALPGYSGRAYETVVYADDAAALAALRAGEIDAALVAADDFSALSAEEYEFAAVTVRRTLTLLAAPGEEAGRVFAPETLRGSAEIALWAQIAPEEPVEFLPEETLLARARKDKLPRALLPADLAERTPLRAGRPRGALPCCDGNARARRIRRRAAPRPAGSFGRKRTIAAGRVRKLARLREGESPQGRAAVRSVWAGRRL